MNKVALTHHVYRGLLVLLASVAAMPAGASSVDITATFRPNPASPQKNTFVNTTPVSGYCAGFPMECERQNVFSIRLPLRIDSIRAMQPGTGPRDNAMFQVPANWRSLYVQNAATGELSLVEMRIAGIGSNYALSDTAQNLTGAASAIQGHAMLWRLTWANPPSPCGVSGFGVYGISSYGFLWRTPLETPCVKFAQFVIPSMSYTYLDFTYELRTPNPLSMSAGSYIGQLNYSLGPGADFDFGDVMIPNDNQLIFNFTLDVDHHLKVEVPPGGHRIQLEPQGGWQAWLQAGRKPRRLYRDQTVNLWASTAFKMSLECPEPVGNTCSVRNAAGHQVPLDVAVSLPPGLTDASGRPVNRLPLRLDGAGAERFNPSMYVDRQPSTLHFEIKADAVEQMLEHPGSTYSGIATVMWDSQI